VCGLLFLKGKAGFKPREEAEIDRRNNCMAQQIENQPPKRRTATLAVRARIGVPLLFLLGLWAGGVRGQESVRLSIASSQAAEARHRAESTVGFYNLKLGPTGWRFGTALAIEYNDNVDNQEVNPESDFIFRPQVNAQMIWPLSEKNSINLGLGVGILFTRSIRD